MIRLFLTFSVTVFLFACTQDESVAGYDQDQLWQLAELDGQPFPAQASLRFDKGGKVSGQAPCNRYTARQTKPYPWIGFEDISSTRMSCPELSNETVFFEALQSMTLAEVSGDLLLLTSDDGREMLFRAAPTDG